MNMELCPEALDSWTHTAKNQYRKFKTHIPRKGTEQPQSQFPHSCVCERFIYSHDRSAYSAAGNMWTDPGNIWITYIGLRLCNSQKRKTYMGFWLQCMAFVSLRVLSYGETVFFMSWSVHSLECPRPRTNTKNSKQIFMCLWAIYVFPQSICLFCCRKFMWTDPWEFINHSQTHECGNSQKSYINGIFVAVYSICFSESPVQMEKLYCFLSWSNGAFKVSWAHTRRWIFKN